jgi:hypothetical protein
MSVGPCSCADVPTPFAPPAAPLPASVDTTPEGRTLRTRLLEVSATYTAPKESTGTPWGRLNVGPRVVTAPAGEILRTRLFPQSPTYTFSETGSTDTAFGKLKTAAVPCPSTNPVAPLPASVLTFQ